MLLYEIHIGVNTHNDYKCYIDRINQSFFKHWYNKDFTRNLVIYKGSLMFNYRKRMDYVKPIQNYFIELMLMPMRELYV
jgi:hypothetical protein